MLTDADVDTVLFEGREQLTATAWHIGERLDARRLAEHTSIPLGELHPVGAGVGVAFRFGAVVTIEADPEAAARFRETVTRYASGPAAEPETEEALILVRAEAEDVGHRRGASAAGFHAGIPIAAATVGRLLVIAEALARSTALAYYEEKVDRVFDRIEPLARDIRRGQARRGHRALLQLLGDATLTQVNTTGLMASQDNPELVWDEPALDRLWRAVRDEYELVDRNAVLSRKLDLISSTTETYYHLYQARQTHRVEWYIVILIMIEIVIIVYEIWGL